MTAAPLILTAQLDPASQARFDRERRLHFPSAINHLAAHVTLFHHLPGEAETDIAALLDRYCADMAPAPFNTTGLRFLGRGTAYELSMSGVAALRGKLAAAWAGALTPQDRQAWRAHVTVQNKVQPAEARATYSALERGYAPQDGLVTGVALWRYLGGPWEAVSQHPFSAAAPG